MAHTKESVHALISPKDAIDGRCCSLSVSA